MLADPEKVFNARPTQIKCALHKQKGESFPSTLANTKSTIGITKTGLLDGDINQTFSERIKKKKVAIVAIQISDQLWEETLAIKANMKPPSH